MPTRLPPGAGLVLPLLLFAVSLPAHDPITTKLTWSQEISRIVYKRCAGCHHEGGRAFSLVGYDEARPWAKAIRDQVSNRQMPPWGAVKGVGQFRDDPSLSQVEIELLVGWVEGGAPKGDDIYLPRVPAFDSPESASPPTGAGPVQVSSEFVLPGDRAVTAIRPRGLDGGKSMEVTAYLPSGEVEHLIWLRDYRKEWTRTYVFAAPIPLPKGTRIRVFSAPAASASLYLTGTKMTHTGAATSRD